MAGGGTDGRHAGKIAWRIFRWLLGVIVFAVLAALGFLYWQGQRAPDTSGEYVALGSSFAAGYGLGASVPGSPLHCFRTAGGYPARVAQRTGLKLVDMSCAGSTTGHILDGGQLILGPQLAAIGPGTKLVTITSGGNDVGYVADLMVASGKLGWLGQLWSGETSPAADRPYAAVTANFRKIVGRVREVAPRAEIMIIGYPAILPPSGNCPATGVDDRKAGISRDVARLLAEATREAADDTGVTLIDMAEGGVGRDACSDNAWTHGAEAEGGAAFHPTAAGAAEMAERIALALQP